MLNLVVNKKVSVRGPEVLKSRGRPLGMNYVAFEWTLLYHA
jgi:hypothetical protein